MAVTLLQPLDSITAARLNSLYQELDNKAAAALGDHSFLFLRVSGSAAPLGVMGRCFFFVGADRPISSYLGGSNYDHATFTAAVAGATMLGYDDARRVIYLQEPLDLDNSLEAHRRKYTPPGGVETNYWVAECSAYQASPFQVAFAGDWQQPQHPMKTVQAEIIVEDSTLTELDIEAAWNKYLFFRIHNLNAASLTVHFLGASGVVHDLVVPARACRCVRRSGVETGYTDGFKYFQRYKFGDPRSFWTPDISNAPARTNANNIWNCSYLVPFIALLAGLSGPRAVFKLDRTTLADLSGTLWTGLYGNPASGTTILGDLFFHKGKLLDVALASPDWLSQSAEEITFNGFGSIIDDFDAAGVTVTPTSNGFTLKNTDAGAKHYLLAHGTNLLCGTEDGDTVANQRSVLDLTAGFSFDTRLGGSGLLGWGINFDAFPLALSTDSAEASLDYRAVSWDSNGNPTLGDTETATVDRDACALAAATPLNGLQYDRDTVADARAALADVSLKVTYFGPMFQLVQSFAPTGPTSLGTLSPDNAALDGADLQFPFTSLLELNTDGTRRDSLGFPTWLKSYTCAMGERLFGTVAYTIWDRPFTSPRNARRTHQLVDTADGLAHGSYVRTWHDGQGRDAIIGSQPAISDDVDTACQSVAPHTAGEADPGWAPFWVWRDWSDDNNWHGGYWETRIPDPDARHTAFRTALTNGAWWAVVTPGVRAVDLFLSNRPGVTDANLDYLKLNLSVESYNAWASLVNAITAWRPLNFLDHFGVPSPPDTYGLAGSGPWNGLRIRPYNQYGYVWNSTIGDAWEALGITLKTIDDLPASFADVVAAVGANATFTCPPLTIASDDVVPVLDTNPPADTVWASGVSYTPASGHVWHSTRFYSCKLAHTSDASNEPPNTTYWNWVGGGFWHVLSLTAPDPGDISRSSADTAAALRADLAAISAYNWIAVEDVKALAESLGYRYLHHTDGIPLMLKIAELGDVASVLTSTVKRVSEVFDYDIPAPLTGDFPTSGDFAEITLASRFAEFVPFDPEIDEAPEWLAGQCTFTPGAGGSNNPVNLYLAPLAADPVTQRLWRCNIAEIPQRSCPAYPDSYRDGDIVICPDMLEAWRKVNLTALGITALSDATADAPVVPILASVDWGWDADRVPAIKCVEVGWPWLQFDLPYSTTLRLANAKIANSLATVTPVIANSAPANAAVSLHAAGTLDTIAPADGYWPLLWVDYWTPF